MADKGQNSQTASIDTTTKNKLSQKNSTKMPPGFMRDQTGKPSAMRLMSIIALLTSIWFGWITLNSNMQSQNGLYITTAFLLAAFAPKAVQKFIENYYPTNREAGQS